MISKILCATDGSEHSRIAIDYATALAKSTEAGLTFLAVNAALGGARAPLIYQWDEEDHKRILEEAASAAKQAGLSDVNTVAIKSRTPSWAITQYAEEEGFDLIIVGTGGRSLISRLMLGSVAGDVSARAHCSVIIAR